MSTLMKYDLPKCQFNNCNKIAFGRISENDYSFDICEEHFHEYQKNNKVVSSRHLEEIPLNNYGSFRTKSVVETNGKFSQENFSQFGEKKRKETKEWAEHKQFSLAFLMNTIRKEKDNIEIIHRITSHEKREFAYLKCIHLNREVEIWMTPNSLEPIFVEDLKTKERKYYR